MSKNKIFIIGSGGHCRPLIEVLNEKYQNINKQIFDFNFDRKKKEKILGANVVGSFKNFLKKKKNFTYLAVGNNEDRKKIYNKLKKKKINMPNLISNTSTISKFIKIGNANFVNKKSFIGTNVTLGNNNIINSESVIEHETIIKNHTHIGPRCVIGGRSKIGSNVFLGLGSKVLHRIKICDNCTIGAGTIVNKDIEYPGVYVGAPARRVIKNKKDITNKKIIVATYGDVGISLLQNLFKERFNKSNLLIFTHHNQKNNERLIDYLKYFKIDCVYDHEKKENLIKQFKKFKPDLLLSFHYRKKISKDILKLPKFNSVNAHPSLLPKYAGCFSSVWALFNDEKETGITYHSMTNKFDAGNIIFQTKILINQNDTAFSLFHNLLDLSLKNLINVLDLVFNKKFLGTPQDLEKRTYYGRRLPNNGLIKKNWSKEKIRRFTKCLYYPPHDETRHKIKKKKYKT